MIDHVFLFGKFDSLSGEEPDDGTDGARQGNLVQPDIEDPPADLQPDRAVVHKSRDDVDCQVDERKAQTIVCSRLGRTAGKLSTSAPLKGTFVI